MPDFDLFVIGGGSGGVACARRAASHGAKVGIAEGSRVGGTCVIRGCVPKKLMHYGAHFAEAFKAARCYGWDTGDPRLAFERLCEARNTEIGRLNGIYMQMLGRSGVQLLDGLCPHRGPPPTAFASTSASARSPPPACWSPSAPGPACPSCRASSSRSPPTRSWRTSTPCPSAWR